MAWQHAKVRYFEQNSAPTVNDDQNDGYRVSDIWIDLSTDTSYRCLDASAGAAVWKEDSTINHNSLSGLQGGAVNEYHHLTSVQHGNLHTDADAIKWAIVFGG